MAAGRQLEGIWLYQFAFNSWREFTPGTYHDRRLVAYTISGALEVAAGALRLPNATGKSLIIAEVRLDIGTAPSGSSAIVDVNKDGTTIFEFTADQPIILSDEFIGSTTEILDNIWADGEYLTIDVDQIGSGVAGSDLTVTIVCY